MRVCGLDLSLNRPGFAVVEVRRRKPRLIIATHLKNKASLSHGDRLAYLKAYLVMFMYDHGPFDAVVRERGFHNQRATATVALAKVAGIADYELRRQGVEELTPSEIKKALTGNGRGGKEEVAKAVLRYFPHAQFATDDESDATAAALAYLIKNDLIEVME
jgi:crossover junction endodeoxyribonuclease RuvC